MIKCAFRFVFICFWALGIPFLISGCKDNPYLSLATLPASNMLDLNTIDSFTIHGGTILSDSVLASGLSSYLLGQTKNNDFGVSNASLYTSFSLPSDQFESLGIIDSMFLTLQYAGIYGDTNSLHQLVLYEVNPNSAEAIKDNVPYYSNADFTTLPNLIGSKSNFKFTPKDSININGLRLAPHVRIRITDNSFIAKIQNQTGSTGFLNNTAFHTIVNGIYVKDINPAANSFMYINTSSAAISGLFIYHKTSTGKDTTSIFHLGQSSTNSFKHNYTGTAVANHLNVKKDSVIYLQGIGGLQGRIYIPYLSSIKNVIVNKAELIIEDVHQGNASTFLPPTTLFIYRKDSISHLLEDVTIGSPFSDVSTGNYFGGVRSKNYNYSFNIARYIQKVVDNQTSPFDGFYINVLGSSINPGQLIIGTGAATHFKMKLKLNLTKLN
jgi:hypothetical protein